jgi:hypothetical protein
MIDMVKNAGHQANRREPSPVGDIPSDTFVFRRNSMLKIPDKIPVTFIWFDRAVTARKYPTRYVTVW